MAIVDSVAGAGDEVELKLGLDMGAVEVGPSTDTVVVELVAASAALEFSTVEIAGRGVVAALLDKSSEDVDVVDKAGESVVLLSAPTVEAGGAVELAVTLDPVELADDVVSEAATAMGRVSVLVDAEASPVAWLDIKLEDEDAGAAVAVAPSDEESPKDAEVTACDKETACSEDVDCREAADGEEDDEFGLAIEDDDGVDEETETRMGVVEVVADGKAEEVGGMVVEIEMDDGVEVAVEVVAAACLPCIRFSSVVDRATFGWSVPALRLMPGCGEECASRYSSSILSAGEYVSKAW